MSPSEDPDLPAHPRPWRALFLVLLKIAVVVVGVLLVIRLAKRVDWAHLIDALGHFHWWQVAVVCLVVLGRQILMGLPLAYLVPGLGGPRAVANGLAGNLITTFTPPPSEIMLRLAMLKSWRFEPAGAMSALSLNAILFYLAYFVAPLLGLVFAGVALSITAAHWWSAAWGVVIAAAIVAVLAVMSRGASAAARLGRGIGSAIRRVVHRVDPEAVARRFVEFQRTASSNLLGRMTPGLMTLLAYIVVDGTIVWLALRFIGVGPSTLSYPALLGAFLCVYPMTIFPFAGLGVLEAALVTLLNDIAVVDPTQLLAALVFWRAVTLAFPLLPGALTLVWWRRTRPSVPDDPVPPSNVPTAEGIGTDG